MISRLLKGLSYFSAIIILVIFAGMVFFLMSGAWPAMKHLSFTQWLLGSTWLPSAGQYSLLPMILTSIVLGFGSLLLCMVFSIIVSILFSQYTSPFWKKKMYSLLKILAAIPSVVYGLWGLEHLLPVLSIFHDPAHGYLVGIMVLTVMTVPSAILILISSFDSIPQKIWDEAASLGMSKIATFMAVIWPRSFSAMKAAGVISFLRAIGETIAVMLVTGNIVQFPTHPFLPVRALTANIALGMGFATELHRSVLFLSAALLMIFVFLFMYYLEKLMGRKNA
ncbi:MAG: ABC transporter permease subunit [Candidatus Hydrogenedentota bacterium]|nr:MAG: ABC transporter permease subunit [Candidatus Hydrogenedentota bacterium]